MRIKKNRSLSQEEDDQQDNTFKLKALRIQFENPKVGNLLVSTGNNSLAEASYDTKWGTWVDLYMLNYTENRFKGKNILCS